MLLAAVQNERCVICELKDGKFVPLTDWLEP